MNEMPFTLTMRMHSIRHIIRLEGRSPMEHPRHGAGATFHLDIRHYTVTEDLAALADRIDAGAAAHLGISDLTGRVIWDNGAVSEVTWLEFKGFLADDPITVEIHTCDPWPPAGTKSDEHVLGEIDRGVLRHIADSVAYWQARPGPLHSLATRVMAGFRPSDPAMSEYDMKVMAALRHGWREQTTPDQFTLVR